MALMVVFLVGNALSALAMNYTSLTLARFLAGIPHGAYFGVASLVAASLVTAERRGRAVSTVMLGLAVANVAGVPAATWLGQNAGWRSAYWLVTVLALLTVALVWWLVPHIAGNRAATGRNELRAFKKPQVLLDPAGRRDRVRRHVRDVHLHRARPSPTSPGSARGWCRSTCWSSAPAWSSVRRSRVGSPTGRCSAATLLGSLLMGLTLVTFTVTSQWFLPGLREPLRAERRQLGPRRRPADAADAGGR